MDKKRTMLEENNCKLQRSLIPFVVALSLIITPLLIPTHNNIGTAAACPCSQIEKPPAEDRSDSLEKGLKFSHTDEYEKQFEAAIKAAKAACEKHKGERRVAVVSDIDETLLDNRKYYESHLQKFNWDEFFVWMQEADAPALKRTADFLAWARDNGFAIFLITGRHENIRAGTIQNLIREKAAYDGLFMRKNDDHRRAEDFKSEARSQIESMGFKVIVNIGDQTSDLYGGHAEECVKLPNEMYYIP
jgi:hypothetical protein